MSAPDPTFWQDAAKWLAGLLVLPITYVWKKTNDALPKSDFKEFCDRFDKHIENDRDIQAKLFDQIRENDQRAQDRHERIMERLAK